MDSLMPYYFAGLAAIVLLSWLWVRSRPTPRDKNIWSNRLSLVLGIFVIGFICFALARSNGYILIPFFVALGAYIFYANRRGSFYCDACGKPSFSQNPFARTFHCPHCGNKLR
jgi:hypothetical protein